MACGTDAAICTCTQAMSTQEANRAASNKMPPLWAAAAIVLLGWNEFLTVLYNPLWLFIGLIIFLFGKVCSVSVSNRSASQRSPDVLQYFPGPADSLRSV